MRHSSGFSRPPHAWSAFCAVVICASLFSGPHTAAFAQEGYHPDPKDDYDPDPKKGSDFWDHVADLKSRCMRVLHLLRPDIAQRLENYIEERYSIREIVQLIDLKTAELSHVYKTLGSFEEKKNIENATVILDYFRELIDPEPYPQFVFGNNVLDDKQQNVFKYEDKIIGEFGYSDYKELYSSLDREKINQLVEYLRVMDTSSPMQPTNAPTLAHLAQNPTRNGDDVLSASAPIFADWFATISASRSLR